MSSPPALPPDETPAGNRAILSAARTGQVEASQALSAMTYGELHRLATTLLTKERANHTLQPTALVHEAWLRLFGTNGLPPEEHEHFVALATSVMRRVLVDHARRRGTHKRGGTDHLVELSTGIEVDGRRMADVIAVDESLERLARLSERQARIVELRFFGGLDVAQVASHLGLSLSTVEREWRVARAFLQAELDGTG